MFDFFRLFHYRSSNSLNQRPERSTISLSRRTRPRGSIVHSTMGHTSRTSLRLNHPRITSNGEPRDRVRQETARSESLLTVQTISHSRQPSPQSSSSLVVGRSDTSLSSTDYQKPWSLRMVQSFSLSSKQNMALLSNAQI